MASTSKTPTKTKPAVKAESKPDTTTPVEAKGVAAAKAAETNGKPSDEADPAIAGVQALESDEQVAERSPDGSKPGEFTKAFILDRLDLDADGKTPKGFDHNPNIDGVRSFGVQSGVRFTGPIELISDKASKVAPGTRVLTYGGPAVPAGTIDDETGAPVRDHYDPDVVNAGEVDETTKSNSEQAKAAE